MASERCKTKFSNLEPFQDAPKIMDGYRVGDVRSRTTSEPAPGCVTIDIGEAIPVERGTTRIAGRVFWP